MSALGKLSVLLSLDSGQFSTGLSKAEYQMQQFSRSVEGATTSALRGFAGQLLAVGTAVEVVSRSMQSFNKAVDDLDKLDELAQKVGSSASELSKLELVARQNGFAFDQVGVAAEKLIKGLNGADEETKGAAQAIKFLGINAKDAAGNLKDPAILIQEIAKQMDKYGQSASKTALAQDLFGKSGASLIPYLNDIAKAGTLAATVTDEQAAAAAALKDAQATLAAAFQDSSRKLAIELTPSLTAVVVALTQVKVESNALAQNGGIREFADSAARVFATIIDAALTFGVRLKGLGNDLTGVALLGKAALDSLAAGAAASFGKFGEAEKLIAESKQRYADAQAAFAKGSEQSATSVTKFSDALRNAQFAQKALEDSKGFGDARDGWARAEKQVAKYSGAVAKAVKDTDDFAKILSDIQKRSTAEGAEADGAKLTDGQKFALDITLKLADASKKYTDAQKQQAVAALEIFLAQEKQNDSARELKKALEDVNKAMGESAAAAAAEYADALERVTRQNDEIEKGLRDSIEALKTEGATIGLTAKQQALYNLEKERTKALLGAEDDLRAATINALFDEKRALIENNDALKSQNDTWNSLSQAVEGFFLDLFENGKDAFGNLEQTVKRFFKQLAAQMLTKYVLNIGVNGSVSGGGGFLSSLFSSGGSSAQGGGGFNLGSLFSGGSLFSALGTGAANLGLGTLPFVAGAGPIAAGTGLAGFLGAAGSGFGAAIGTLGTALSSGVAAAGGLATVLGSVVPVLGPILAILSATGVFTNKKGFKLDNAGDDGNRTRTNLIDSAFGRYDFAGDFDNKMVEPFIAAINKIDKSIIDTFIKTPEGIERATMRVQSIKDGSWFGANSKGETEESIKAATLRFAKERYAAIFADVDKAIANQIANFSGSTDDLLSFINKISAVKPIFDELTKSVPGFTLALSDFLDLTESQINALSSLGTTLPTLTTNAFDAVNKIVEESLKGTVTRFDEMGDSVGKLLKDFADGKSSIEELADAGAKFAIAYAQATAKIAETQAALDSLFAGTREGFLLDGLNTDEQYKFFQDRANGLFEQLSKAVDPEQIDSLTRQILDYQSRAAGLLSDEERKRLSPEYIAGLDRVQALANERLAAATQKLNEEAKPIKDQIAEALAQFIADNKDAADTQLDAAETNREAANTPRKIEITVRDERGGFVVRESGN